MAVLEFLLRTDPVVLLREGGVLAERVACELHAEQVEALPSALSAVVRLRAGGDCGGGLAEPRFCVC